MDDVVTRAHNSVKHDAMLALAARRMTNLTHLDVDTRRKVYSKGMYTMAMSLAIRDVEVDTFMPEPIVEDYEPLDKRMPDYCTYIDYAYLQRRTHTILSRWDWLPLSETYNENGGILQTTFNDLDEVTYEIKDGPNDQQALATLIYKLNSALEWAPLEAKERISMTIKVAHLEKQLTALTAESTAKSNLWDMFLYHMSDRANRKLSKILCFLSLTMPKRSTIIPEWKDKRLHYVDANRPVMLTSNHRMIIAGDIIYTFESKGKLDGLKSYLEKTPSEYGTIMNAVKWKLGFKEKFLVPKDEDDSIKRKELNELRIKKYADMWLPKELHDVNKGVLTMDKDPKEITLDWDYGKKGDEQEIGIDAYDGSVSVYTN